MFSGLVSAVRLSTLFGWGLVGLILVLFFTPVKFGDRQNFSAVSNRAPEEVAAAPSDLAAGGLKSRSDAVRVPLQETAEGDTSQAGQDEVAGLKSPVLNTPVVPETANAPEIGLQLGAEAGDGQTNPSSTGMSSTAAKLAMPEIVDPDSESDVTVAEPGPLSTEVMADEVASLTPPLTTDTPKPVAQAVDTIDQAIGAEQGPAIQENAPSLELSADASPNGSNAGLTPDLTSGLTPELPQGLQSSDGLDPDIKISSAAQSLDNVTPLPEDKVAVLTDAPQPVTFDDQQGGLALSPQQAIIPSSPTDTLAAGTSKRPVSRPNEDGRANVIQLTAPLETAAELPQVRDAFERSDIAGVDADPDELTAPELEAIERIAASLLARATPEPELSAQAASAPELTQPADEVTEVDQASLPESGAPAPVEVGVQPQAPRPAQTDEGIDPVIAALNAIEPVDVTAVAPSAIGGTPEAGPAPVTVDDTSAAQDATRPVEPEETEIAAVAVPSTPPSPTATPAPAPVLTTPAQPAAPKLETSADGDAKLAGVSTPLQAASDKETAKEKGPKIQGRTLYVSGTRVNLRSTPGIADNVLGSLARGAKLTGYETENGWVRVVADNSDLSGWMAGSLLSPSKQKATAVPRKKVAKAKTVAKPKPVRTATRSTSSSPRVVQRRGGRPTGAEVAAAVHAIISDSVRRNGPCACPYNLDAFGSECGHLSLWSNPPGASPICYPSDVSDHHLTVYFKRRGRTY